MDVQIKSEREECALDMGQRSKPINAAGRDVQIKPTMEECVLVMGQRDMSMSANDAAMMDAQT